MSDNDNYSRILKESRKWAEQSERRDRIKEVANALGNRQNNDLLDLLAAIEYVDGWNAALQCLMEASDAKYSAPLGISGGRAKIEPLKYREMVFALLSCKGLEPIKLDTIVILKELEEENSMVDAIRAFTSRVESTALDQIESGDILFFDIDTHGKHVSETLTNKLENICYNSIRNMIFRQDGEKVNVAPLWHNEYGRRVLAEMGIKGYKTTTSQLESILSLMQVSYGIVPDIKIVVEQEQTEYQIPTNKVYAKLLESIVHQNLEKLANFGSRHCVLTLNVLLSDAVSQYKTNQTSESYRQLLRCIDSHISVRSLESIAAIERVATTRSPRMMSPAITALANFYHESAVSALVDLLCQCKDKTMIKGVISALENLWKGCKDTEPVIQKALQSECLNYGLLKRFYNRMSTHGPYYKSYN